MTTPRTTSGKALLERIAPLGSYGDTAEEYEMEGDEIRWHAKYEAAILAIEAEAVAPWREVVEQVVRATNDDEDIAARIEARALLASEGSDER